MYFFTADEHYGHKNIIQYCNRPFANVEEMNETIINNHNEVVGKRDIVVHAGDFCGLKNKDYVKPLVKRLNGQHIHLKGSHDYWLPKSAPTRWEKKIGDHYFVVDHYAMRVWHRSLYNSFQLYGHSHGSREPIGKQHDIGVDNNNFYPVSDEQIVEIMKDRPDNPNLVKR